MANRPHAEIAGAGLAGLTVAAALGKAGWTVRVHERNPELRELGAGIIVWSNGVFALRHVDAYEEATRGADRVHRWELRDERNRTLQEEWMMPGVSESYAILRTRLHQALARAAERHGVEIVTSSPVHSATPDGKLILADGEVCPADLVIGADGINSPVRESVGLKLAQKDLEDGCGRHLIDRLPSDPKDQILERWVGGRRVGVIPCTPEQVYVFLCCRADDLEGVRQEEGELATWIESFPEFEDYIGRIPPGGRWLSFGDVKVRRWSAGRVALIGDACHAMSPNLGQAACVAMMNSVALAQAVQHYPSVEEALRRWEASERKVTDLTQRYSRFYGWIGTQWPEPALPLRSALIWSLAHSKRAQERINVAARHTPQVTAEP
jgi:2-polyprenyl-6-methoxyphenol hydroxylase-like FAD-dependent oxidoreductase